MNDPLFLIGAGFNVDAIHEAGPVYGNSIYAGCYVIDCGYPLVADVARLCFGLAQAPTDKSIEDLFAEALEGGSYAALQKLSDRVMDADSRLAEQLASSGTSNCYREFFERFPEANFITFNYDSLVEIFLFRMGRWYPEDGYGLPVEVELAHLKPTEFTAMRSKSLVLHLHGTFCVYTSEFEIKPDFGDSIPWLNRLERPAYRFDPDEISFCFTPYRGMMSNTGYVRIEERVIAPIPDKASQLNQPFISETYDKACSFVRKSGTLVVIGYSFNRNDAASYDAILRALAQSRERKLILVSPQAIELAAKIRAEYNSLQLKPIDKSFKDWAGDSFRC